VVALHATSTNVLPSSSVTILASTAYDIRALYALLLGTTDSKLCWIYVFELQRIFPYVSLYLYLFFSMCSYVILYQLHYALP